MFAYAKLVQMHNASSGIKTANVTLKVLFHNQIIDKKNSAKREWRDMSFTSIPVAWI